MSRISNPTVIDAPVTSENLLRAVNDGVIMAGMESDEPIVAMKDRLMRYRTCAAGCKRRLYGKKNLFQQRGSELNRDAVDNTIRTIG